MLTGLALLIGLVEARDFFAHPSGAVGAAATFDAPLPSVQACVDALSQPGDRCLLKAATWTGERATVTVRGKHGSPAAPMVIAAAGNGPVVFDGTVLIETPWVRDAQGRFATTPPLQVHQLFARPKAAAATGAMEMQVPARWPNARFDDRSMYFAPENWAHAGPKGTGVHDVKTGDGRLQDAGACATGEECCGLCNHNDLAKSGVNATGAVAVLNLWAGGTGFQVISQHRPGTNTLRYNATWINGGSPDGEGARMLGDSYAKGVGRYYLEGPLQLLDAQSEWSYTAAPFGTLSWLPPKPGSLPDAYEVRAKNQTNAFEFLNSSFVTIANLSFFATALRAHDDAASSSSTAGDGEDGVQLTSQLSHLTFESLDFDYPSASRRMLGSTEPFPTVEIWTSARTHDGNRNPAFTYHTLVDLRFRFSDSMALQAQGSGWSITNCLWEWNTWTGLGSAAPGMWKNNAAFLLYSSASPTLSRLSFANNGPSKAVKIATNVSADIELVDFGSILQTEDDGCMLESGGSHSMRLLRSWSHDAGKGASRFDGDLATGTAHGAFIGNVAWNVSGFSVKGDYHNVSFNTVFDGSDIGAGNAAHTYPSAQTHSSPLTNTSKKSLVVETWDKGSTLTTANTHTVFEGNLIDGMGTWKGRWEGGKGTAAGTYNCTGDPAAKVGAFTGVFPDCPVNGNFATNNVVGSWLEVREHTAYDVKVQLRDAWHRDFRPCPGSLAAAHGAGAYKVWAATDAQHWIPGAKDRDGASQPSPRDGGAGVATDADLIFLGAFRATAHVVLIAQGGAGGSYVQLATLTDEDNIAHPALKPNTSYAWRVDASFADGSTITGPEWTFATGARTSCETPAPTPAPEPTPAPAPTPSPTPPGSCQFLNNTGLSDGTHLGKSNVASQETCCALCLAEPACAAADFHPANTENGGKCTLNNQYRPKVRMDGSVACKVERKK